MTKPPDGRTEVSDAPAHEHEQSLWPFVAAAGAGALYLGAAVALFAGAAGIVPTSLGIAVAVAGGGVVVVGLFGWLDQAYVGGMRAADERKRASYRMTMVLFLVTDVATFGAGFAYYFYIRAGAWTPADVPDVFGSLVLVNTAVLVASSVTLHVAHSALGEGNQRRFRRLLGVTVALGVVFVVGQVFEYYEFVVEEGFTLTSGIFGSAFFGLTGLHGLHVLLGVVLLSIVFGRAVREGYAAGHDTSVTTVSWYWHFVDAVWLFLVVYVYAGATLVA
ncbi:cytochrome c oxidase subunit 3 [Halomicrococcus sp. NG-SE-24]|uniref:cytochrome c oxidase subunit 3 n=1 Tax=Halomicrococcus sp. NG-SE-24 TaxID=3436928 RepID=UPI003D984D31